MSTVHPENEQPETENNCRDDASLDPWISATVQVGGALTDRSKQPMGYDKGVMEFKTGFT